jgi:hypothetical protein
MSPYHKNRLNGLTLKVTLKLILRRIRREQNHAIDGKAADTSMSLDKFEKIRCQILERKRFTLDAHALPTLRVPPKDNKNHENKHKLSNIWMMGLT